MKNVVLSLLILATMTTRVMSLEKVDFHIVGSRGTSQQAVVYPTFSEIYEKACQEFKKVVVCKNCNDLELKKYARLAKEDGYLLAVADKSDDRFQDGRTLAEPRLTIYNGVERVCLFKVGRLPETPTQIIPSSSPPRIISGGC